MFSKSPPLQDVSSTVVKFLKLIFTKLFKFHQTGNHHNFRKQERGYYNKKMLYSIEIIFSVKTTDSVH